MRRFGFLFRWDGRIGGRQLLVYSVAVAVLSTILSMALALAILRPDPVLGGYPADARFLLVWFIGQLPGIASTASLIGRRLHDFGHSAAWVIPILGYAVVLATVSIRWPQFSHNWIALLLIAPWLALVLWLYTGSGNRGDNRYGAVPPS
ncbi:MAG: hypothetical protein DCF16_02075 [Alphaproteobacteria bacterium]|nr:MAG: hypothetical protein DCF16_02075 [Alphaproteobacteria bacterium]